MNKKHTTLLAIGTFLLVSALTAILFSFFLAPLDSGTIRTNATVVTGNLIGFNVDTDVLAFGQVPQGSYGKRYVNLSNMRNYPIIVTITSNGNISPHILVTQDKIIIQPYETLNVSIIFNPSTAELGTYEGTITFIYYRKTLFSNS